MKKRPFIFKYDRIGHICIVENDEMERLFKALKRMGVEVETKYVKPKRKKETR